MPSRRYKSASSQGGPHQRDPSFPRALLIYAVATRMIALWVPTNPPSTSQTKARKTAMTSSTTRTMASASKRARWMHGFFEFAILIKGIDGILETAGGFLLLFVPLRAIDDLVQVLTAHELSEEPDDWFANTLRHAAESISVDTKMYASIYLVSHGVLKIFLVYFLWREKLWAFPVAIAFIVAFIGYQLYRYAHTHSVALLIFTAIDVAVTWFIWREYRARLQLARI